MKTDWTDKICIAAFQNRDNARRAVHDLEKSGFDDKQVGLIHRDEAPINDSKREAIGRDHAAGAAVGAGSGAVLGAIVGAATAFVFPPAGVVVVAGALLGLATGAVAGGVLGALTGMGVPKVHAEYYEREFEAGRAIVVVMCEGRTADALTILRNHGGYQLDETGQVQTGETAPEQTAPATGGREVVGTRAERVTPVEEPVVGADGEIAGSQPLAEPVATEPVVRRDA